MLAYLSSYYSSWGS